jgi:hypothetical protein
MRTRWMSAPVVVLSLVWGASSSARAEESAKKKPGDVSPPSPTSTVQAMLKGLAKAKGYRVAVDIEGGFSTQADHAVTQRTVRESYAGDVNGTLMKCPDPKIYRTAGKGVSFVDGQWRAILSDPKGVKLDRLFKFPEIILQRALKHAKSGQWVASARDEEDDKDEDLSEDHEADEDSSQPKGKTVVVKKKAEAAAGKPAKLPRLLRIEASPEEALNHIIEVQNSNCFGGG